MSSATRRTALAAAAIGIVSLVALLAGQGTSSGTVRVRAAYAQQCADPYSSVRDPSNPLMLTTPPGSDQLNGASFFVDGARHGAAAKAIEQLLGIDPTGYADNYSWTQFQADLNSGSLHDRLSSDPILRYKVSELEKIAAEPEAQRFSIYSGGGGPGAIYGQVQKIFCGNLTADPGTIPIITTYFLHPVVGGCPSRRALAAAGPTFRRRVDEVAAGTGNRPAVYLLELDAIGSSGCIARSGLLPEWEADLRYEVRAISALPHTVVYLEAGYSDANGPRYTARVLNASGVRQIRGFFTNDTHLNWTIDEVRWAERVSRLTGGAHFIVNTAQNGNGPKRTAHPTAQGNNVLCNPPGRGLGPRPTTSTGFPGADAFLWTHVPGNSSGHCNGGPDPGVFWPTRAIDLATHANGKLGPGYPSEPY